MSNNQNVPGLLRLPPPLMEVDATSQRSRSKGRRTRSKPKQNKNPGQLQNEVGVGESKPDYQPLPIPQRHIYGSQSSPVPATRPQQQPHHRNTYYSSRYSSKSNDAGMTPHQQTGGGGVASMALKAAGLLPPKLSQTMSSSVPLWRRQGQEEGSNSSRGMESSTPQKTRVITQKSIPHPTYARVFYTMMDNPALNVRRDPEFTSFNKLSLKNQLEEMQLALSLTPDGQRQRLQILEHILHVLKKEYPFCHIYPFGSYLTGLGDSTSDVDLYVDAFGVTAGEKLPKTASGTLDVLERCFRSLRRAKCPTSYKVLCKHLIPIREARVPILKITHWSNVNVDLSFENLTSLRNSEMISLYMKLDPCVKPLMVLIRFWARFHCLTGSNNIKNYCLVLMVLVFLSSKNIVPSVEKLHALREVERRQESHKSKSKDTNSDIIDDWDTGFAKLETIRRSNLATKTSIIDSKFGGDLLKTVLKLAQEFFEMFGNIDFSSFVVCTRTAEILPLQLFKPGNEEDLPEALDKYKDWAVQQPSHRRLNIRNPLCVQDPFILSFNVGAVTPFTTLFKFQVACREAVGILESGISSLLELFIPLPKEVGDRKFLNMQEKQRETLKLKKDINQFLECGKFPSAAQPEDAEVSPISEESLGLHRLPLQEIIDKNSIRFGKGWESLSTLFPSEEFQNLFAGTVLKHKLHRSERSARDLFEKLKQLWLSFLGDFFEEFWEKCFLLKVHKDEREISDRLFANPPFGSRIRKNYELIFTERKGRNTKQQNESSASDINLEDGAILDGKLSTLGSMHYKITCRKLTCTAFLPVWQKRMKIYNEIMDHLNPVSPTTDGNDDSAPRSRRQRHRKPHIDTDDINPLEIQKRVTEVLQEELQPQGSTTTTKPLLTFSIFIKIENCYVDDLPVVSVVCEKVADTPSNLYNQGVSSIMETLTEALEPYCMYRLKDWINPHSRGSADDLLSNTSSPESLENEIEDFDALMPPTPSSSECSSPVEDLDQFSSLVTGEWEDEK